MNNKDEFKIVSKSKELEFESIGRNTLLGKGNCVDFLKFIKSSTVDLILTDPPYNLGNFMHNRNTNLVKMRENQFAYAGWAKTKTIWSTGVCENRTKGGP